MSEFGETQSRGVAIEMTRDRIEMYRDAARGWLEVHTFSYGGSVQRECFTEAGTPLAEPLMTDMCQGVNEQGEPVVLDYDGVMVPVECAQLADSLEKQIV